MLDLVPAVAFIPVILKSYARLVLDNCPGVQETEDHREATTMHGCVGQC